MEASESPDWLPAGWIEQVKLRNGRRIKCYVELLTDCKFYSKPQVLRYLKHVKRGNSTSEMSKTEYDSVGELKEMEVGPHRETKKMEDCSQCNENESPEWLPRGWIMELKPPQSSSRSRTKYKCFIDPLTGWKFYSKPQVFHSLNAKFGYITSEPEKRGDGSEADFLINSDIGQFTGGMISAKPASSQNLETTEEKNFSSVQEEINYEKKSRRKVVIVQATPDKLPPGWIKEIKIERKSSGIRKDPFYTDPVSGYVFRSQRDALRYLETGDIYECAITPKKRDEVEWLTGESGLKIVSMKLEGSQHLETEKRKTLAPEQEEIHFDDKFGEKVVISRETPDKLPPGWIKEIKIQLKPNGIRKDPYYTDPASGYVFRSQRDALRYLESGDIRRCAIKPKKRDQLEWLTGESFPPSAVDTLKLGQQTTERQLFAGEQNVAISILETEVDEASQEQQCKSLASDAVTAPTTAADIREGNNSLDNAMSECSTMEDENLLGDGKGAANVKSTEIDSGKPTKRKGLSLPSRSSKRLAGLKQELAAGKSGIDAKVSLDLTLNTVANSTHNSKSPEAPRSIQPFNSRDKHIEEEAVVEDPHLRQEAEERVAKKPELELNPYGASFSDPCLDYAFKTLAGSIAMEDDLVAHGCIQQEVNTYNTRMDDVLPIPKFGSPNFPCYAPGKHAPGKHTPVENLMLYPEIVSSHNSSGSGPQEIGLEEKMEHRRKAKH